MLEIVIRLLVNVATRNDFVYAFADVNVVSRNDVFDIQFCKIQWEMLEIVISLLVNAGTRNDFVYAFADVNVVSRNDVFDIQFCKLAPFCTTRFNVWNMIILMTFRFFGAI